MVDALAPQRKALALLALLAAYGRAGVSRDAVLAYLWPDSDEERARTSLKQLVHTVRQVLGDPRVLQSSPTLRLDPARISSDVAEFRAAIGRGDHEQAAQLYAGPFLAGFYVKGADEFERWVATERGALGQEFGRALEAMAEQAQARGDIRAAIVWWRRLAAVEPLSARVALGLMRALEQAGDRASAVAHARQYEQFALEELGGLPDAAVAELAAELARGSSTSAVPTVTTHATGSAAASPAPAPSTRPSIAVLPFVNTSGDPADEPLSDGLADELITAISRVPGLAVTGRTSVFALKGSGLDAQAIGAKLGVHSILEGSVRRAGQRLKITARLINPADAQVLWSQTYDRPSDDIFAVQEEIARSTAEALRARLLAPAGLLGRHAADLLAYEHYLKGRYIVNMRSSGDQLEQAVRYFEQAVARDPGFAPAYAGLSDVYAFLAIIARMRAHDAFPKALAAARKAIALDDTLAEAHASLAHALFVYDFEWVAAERAFRRAVALDPGYTFARLAFAVCLQDQARFQEAVEQLQAARAADPLALHVNAVLGRVFVNARSPERAIPVLLEAMEIAPELDLVHQQLGHAYLQTGESGKAIHAFETAAQLSGVRDSAHLSYAYAAIGEHGQAQHLLDSVLHHGEHHNVLPFHVAMVYAALGQHDDAFHWLERGYNERASFMDGVKVTPAFDRLHADARWRSLVKKMNLG